MIALLTEGFPSTAAANVASNHAPDPGPVNEPVTVPGLNGPLVGRPGWEARYVREGDNALADSVVKEFTIAWGPFRQWNQRPHQWIRLSATKAGNEQYRVWLFTDSYPLPTLNEARKSIARYILQEGASPPVEFRDGVSEEAVLPSLGGWQHLLPRGVEREGAHSTQEPFPSRVRYLGHAYRLIDQKVSEHSAASPPDVRVVALMPDVLVGVPHNTRQKDGARRYDDSDYELVRLTREDYREMVDAGMNCLRVDAEQLSWIRDWEVFYWGVGGTDVPYPECFYRSRYLGPALFLDEPAVCTRDHVIRPRLRENQDYRESLTPQIAFEALQHYFREESLQRTPWSLIRGLGARSDVDLGAMKFPQENLYSWETMVSSAAYQLSRHPQVPAAMVFEPPGRVGTLRTLPELNMSYGCQIPVDDPKNFTVLITGFLRGAAKLTDKSWGMSVYGSVDRADAFWYLTHAYDLGATRFFFWDTHRLACVPYSECLALARALKARVENRPHRDLERLARAAEVAILLPLGYNLGHVHLGRGNLWGVGELNLERTNRNGVKYRVVMANFFTEIERCIRLGVAFDLLWDLPGLPVTGYREVVRIREDGMVDIETEGRTQQLDGARTPTRPDGPPPQLAVELSSRTGKAPLRITAHASVVETAAPVYYTLGTDSEGAYQNAVVAWELYGPHEEDYRDVRPAGLKPRAVRTGDGFEVRTVFSLDRPGRYRLRVSTVDLAGRTSTIWRSIDVVSDNR